MANQPALSPRHLQLLALLIKHERLTAPDAQLLRLSPSRTSQLAHRLVDVGYASRIQAPNRRFTHFSPTDAGRALDANMRDRVAGAPPLSVKARA